MEPFDNIEGFLIQRRLKEYETEFEEKEIQRRYNPEGILANGKSIIAIGLSYNLENKIMNKNSAMGILSKSSWGIDYHDIVKEKMELLVDEMKKVKDFEYKMHVDTGPLIDREVAKRAGIGWYGKNCSIINDEYGSFIFIGYIVTDIEIEKDEKKKEKCGDCRLCIDACPVGAIEEGYIINATKCIAYLTQTKKKIPYELREKMGVKIYGCDTCQLVCPHNKNVTGSRIEKFLPNVTNGYFELEELLSISKKEFKQKYGHIAGSWRGKNVLKRNAIIALGNIGDKKSIDLLIPQLEDLSPMVREYTAWSLLKIDKEKGIELITQQIELEKDNYIKTEFVNLINYFEKNHTS